MKVEAIQAQKLINKEEVRSGFVALIGPANSGKSTLLNSLLKTKVSIVSPKVQTTRKRVLGIKNTESSQIIFVDTPGFVERAFSGELERALKRETSDVLKDIDIAVLVVDAERAVRNASYLDQTWRTLSDEAFSKVKVVALNKVDLLDKPRLLPLIVDLQTKTREKTEGEVSFVPVSGKSGDGLKDLVDSISHLLPFGPRYYPVDMVSDQSEVFLISELIREKLFNRLQQELPYSLAVSVENIKEEPTLIRISAQILLDRESQKPIVIGKQGSVLKAVGTAARLELEQTFNKKVFLELHAKVKKNWTKSERDIQHLLGLLD